MIHKKVLTTILICLTIKLVCFAALPPVIQKRILEKLPELDLNKDNLLSDEELKVGRNKLPENHQKRIDLYFKMKENRSSSNSNSTGKAKAFLEKHELKGKLNVAYKTSSTNETVFDIIYPKVKKYEKAPLFILIHGGGYVGGTRNKLYGTSFILNFLNEGIAVATLDYRLGGKKDAVMMNEIHTDCKDAIRFLAKHATEYGIDPHKMVTWGTSAGGSLALVTALTDEDYLKGAVQGEGTDHTVVGSVVYYGAMSFVNEEIWKKRKKRSNKNILFQPNNGLDEKTIRELCSPEFMLKSDSPPLLLFYGDKDTTVPVENGRYFNEIAKSLKADVTYVEIKNAGHGFGKSVGGPASMTPKDIETMLVEHVFKWVL